jgi:hypothetical protein
MHLLYPDLMDEAALRNHQVFVDLNLYPSDVDALLALKEKISDVVEAMNL